MIDEVTVLRLRAELAKAQEKERARIIEILTKMEKPERSMMDEPAIAYNNVLHDAIEAIEESV